MTNVHTFHALAFIENFSLKELAAHYPEAKRAHQHLWYTAAAGGTVFIFSFGVVVFLDLGQAGREGELLRLRHAPNGMRDAQVISEEFTVREVAGARADMSEDGCLVVDVLTPERASMAALTVAQSAAMEYYERIVDGMFSRTDHLVERLEHKGRAPLMTRPLHRFIGAAIGTRNEVLSILHLLDKPDAVWDDKDADRIYQELRAEFDLSDRYLALEHKLRSVQEALELVLDMSRDYRLVVLEITVVLLIVAEILLSLFRH